MKTDSQIEGFLLIDKPKGPTSMGVVSNIRRRIGKIRCGHGGTLDPLATGLLVIGVGRATKQLSKVTDAPKCYKTVIDLSAFTETDDGEGSREEVEVETPPSIEFIEHKLEKFRGIFLQRPPAYSAIKVKGVRSYKLARKGSGTTLEPRRAVTHDISIVSYSWPYLELKINCEKGFYVRSLARELGESMHTGGYCHSICRTCIGSLNVKSATKLSSLPESINQENLLATDQVLAVLSSENV